MRKMKCRAVAGLLSLAMVIPMFPASMAALAEPIEPTDAATQDQLPLELSSTAFNAVLFAGTPWPVKMHVNQDTTGKPDGTGELPTVTVEVNGVLDESNKLTGFAEVALRIKPGVLYYDKADTTHTPLTGKDAADALVASGGEVITEIQPFSTVAVALEYSSKLIPWEWDKLDGNWQKRDEAVDPAEAVDLSTTIDKGLSQEGMVEIPVLHKKTRIAQGKVSAFADNGPKGNNDGVEGNDGGYLFLSAEGFTADDFNEEDTVTVVARFKYDLDQNDDNKNPWGTAFPKGAANPDVMDWIDVTKPEALVKLVEQSAIDDELDPVLDQPVVVVSGKSVTYPKGNAYYWSDDKTSGMGAYDTTKPVTDPDFFRTDYNCFDAPLPDLTTPPATPDTTAVVTGKINYTLVNKLSYNFSGGDPKDFVTIHFYDWDDTSLGTVIVKRNVDARERINDFVRSSYIYTDGTNDPAGNDTNLSLQDNTDAAVSSLARMENYRGKYDYTGPAPEPANPVVADGENYPLTNKLDYVFFKRPMENNETKKPDDTDTTKYPGGATDPDYLADLALWEATEYIQKSDAATGDAEWDTEFPYIHGWAVIPQGQKTSSVWTTLGVGELKTYTDYLKDSGGATTNAGAPAELSVNGGELLFADFDFSENPVPASINEIAVKAVYEPGEDLLNAYQYRQVKDPYYNKFNYLTAAAGGAYEVETAFERADDVNKNVNPATGKGDVHGVNRIREPYVRQDTTTDLRWEEIAAKNVKHDLPLTVNSDAYGMKPTTSYAKVDVANTDVITFSLALSARHNKIDYYLTDGYGDNFISGGQRTYGDNSREGSAVTVDNYNYLFENNADPTDDSDLTDDYWDVTDYELREGSHGFVLYGTLNNLMQKATEAVRGDITNTVYNRFVSADTMGDANLRVDADTAANATLRDVLKAAATEAMNAHNAGDDSWWNTDRDFAQLTYHELQWFITDYLANGSATIRTAATGLNDTISWCHLDANCAAASSGKPTTWAELIDKADQGASADIEKLTAADMERYFHLRKDGAGTQYTGAEMALFSADVIAAVAALKAAGVALTDITWDHVQYYIDKQTVDLPASNMDTYGAGFYWWYDGATTGAPSDWTEFESAVKAASNMNLLPATTVLPDGRGVNGRPAKLDQLETAFDNDADPTKNSAPWYAATHNLCAALPGATDGEGVRFTTFAAFKTAVIDAWEQAHALATPVDNPSWKQVQYHIIHKNDPGYPGFPADDSVTQPESDGYWWYDGGTKVSTVITLLEAAHKANAGDSTALDSLTAADVNNFAGLQFRVGFNGTTDVVTTTNFAQFKSDVCAIEAAHGKNLTWEQLQYLLIHGVTSADLTIAADRFAISDEAAAYYWWKDKGDGSGAGFVPPITVTDPNTLMEAAYRSKANGNPHAWDNLTSAAQLADVADAAASTTSSFRLVKDYPSGAVNFSDLTAYTDAELPAAKTALEALYTAVATAGTEDYDSLTWYQIQHYLLTGDYLAASDPNLPGSTVYWWKENASDPTQVTATPETDFGKVLNKLTDYVNGTITLNDVLSSITDSMWTNMGFVVTDGAGGYEAITSSNLAQVETEWLNAESSTAIASFNYFDWNTNKVDLTWYQIQDILLNGSMNYYVFDPWTSQGAVEGMGIYQPTWAYTYWPDGANKDPGNPIPMTVQPGSNDPAALLIRGEAQLNWLLEQAERDPDFAQRYSKELEAYFAKVDAFRAKIEGEELPPEAPVETPIEPEEPTEPTEPPAEPEEPIEPTEPPTETEEPTEPTEPPAETEEPTEPTDPPAETEEPTDPPAETEEPAEPADPPAETEEPTEPTDPPAETEEPTEPADSNVGSDITHPDIDESTDQDTEPDDSTDRPGDTNIETPGGISLARSFRMQRTRKLLREKVPWTYGGLSSGARSRPTFRALIAIQSLEQQNTSNMGGKLS